MTAELQDAVLNTLIETGGVESESGAAVRDLADMLGTPRPAISGAVGRLVKAGLVKRTVRGKRTFRLSATAAATNGATSNGATNGSAKATTRSRKPTTRTRKKPASKALATLQQPLVGSTVEVEWIARVRSDAGDFEFKAETEKALVQTVALVDGGLGIILETTTDTYSLESVK